MDSCCGSASVRKYTNLLQLNLEQGRVSESKRSRFNQTLWYFIDTEFYSKDIYWNACEYFKLWVHTHALQNFATIPVSNVYKIKIDTQEQNMGAILTLEIHSLMNQRKDQDQMQDELLLVLIFRTFSEQQRKSVPMERFGWMLCTPPASVPLLQECNSLQALIRSNWVFHNFSESSRILYLGLIYAETK